MAKTTATSAATAPSAAAQMSVTVKPSSVTGRKGATVTTTTITTVTSANNNKSGPPTPTGFFSFRWLFHHQNNAGANRETNNSNSGRSRKTGNVGTNRRRHRWFRQKSCDKFAAIGDSSSTVPNGATLFRLPRQSYSFDDAQRFLLTNDSVVVNGTDDAGGLGALEKSCVDEQSSGSDVKRKSIGASNLAVNLPSQTSSSSLWFGDGRKAMYKSNLELAILQSQSSGDKTHSTKNKLAVRKCGSVVVCKLCFQKRATSQMHSIWSCGCSFCKDVCCLFFHVFHVYSPITFKALSWNTLFRIKYFNVID